MRPAIHSLLLGARDVPRTEDFCRAVGLEDRVHVRPADEPSEGFRGFTVSPLVADPRQVDAFMRTAEAAGAKVIKPARKSLWGYGGSVLAPDGSVWTVASSRKRPRRGEPAPPLAYESLVLLLGVRDARASQDFYVRQGLEVAKSFGSYVEFALADSPVQLALNPRRATARNAGVDAKGDGPHLLTVVGDLGEVTDPDGFAWAPASGS